MPSGKVLCIGEVLFDVEDGQRKLGGAPANVAFHLNSLGLSALLASRIGRDASGIELEEQLRATGLNLSLLQKDEHAPTGTVKVWRENGQPKYTIVPAVAYDSILPTPTLLSTASAADVICFGTLIQRTPRGRETLYAVLDAAKSATLFLDINLRDNCHTAETVDASLKRAHIVKLSLEEIGPVGKLVGVDTNDSSATFMERLIERYPNLDTTIVTRGAGGVIARSRLGFDVDLAGCPGIRPVDPVGAGDAFNAAFIAQFLRGQPLPVVCSFANVFAALKCERYGAMARVSQEETLQRMIDRGIPQLTDLAIDAPRRTVERGR